MVVFLSATLIAHYHHCSKDSDFSVIKFSNKLQEKEFFFIKETFCSPYLHHLAEDEKNPTTAAVCQQLQQALVKESHAAER